MEEKKHHGSNWAKWSIEHRQLVYFFAFLILVMGIFSFKSLGRSEDPSFTVKQMVVSAAWPGASAKDVEDHLTNTLEKQIQNLPQIDKITSYSRPGSCVITVSLKDEVHGNQVRQRWLELRNMVNDIQRICLPAPMVLFIMTVLMMFTVISMHLQATAIPMRICVNMPKKSSLISMVFLMLKSRACWCATGKNLRTNAD